MSNRSNVAQARFRLICTAVAGGTPVPWLGLELIKTRNNAKVRTLSTLKLALREAQGCCFEVVASFRRRLFSPSTGVKPALFLRYFCVICRPACVFPRADRSWDRAFADHS